VSGALETWTDPDGEHVAMVAGECGRCGSRVLLAPTENAVEHIRAREQELIDRKGRARQAIADMAAARDGR
jgi:hypothetical protein